MSPLTAIHLITPVDPKGADRIQKIKKLPKAVRNLKPSLRMAIELEAKLQLIELYNALQPHMQIQSQGWIDNARTNPRRNSVHD